MKAFNCLGYMMKENNRDGHYMECKGEAGKRSAAAKNEVVRLTGEKHYHVRRGNMGVEKPQRSGGAARKVHKMDP